MFLLDLPRFAKQMMLLALDMAILPVALMIALGFRFGAGENGIDYTFLWIVSLVGGVVVVALGLPKIKLHAIETRAIGRIGVASLALCAAAIAIGHGRGIQSIESVGIVFGSLFFLIALGGRMLVLFTLLAMREQSLDRTPVAIYGAGAAGIRIANFLQQSESERPVMFVDDSPQLRGMIVAGLPVHEPSELMRQHQRGRIKRVLLAIPSATNVRRDEIARDLLTAGLEVRKTPSMADLVSGVVNSAIRPGDILPRESVDLDNPQVRAAYHGAVVMVTGAGGSIGSELCRQLIDCGPKRIILFERSEFALFQIERELAPLAQRANVEIVPFLGSITNRANVTTCIERFKVDCILHAAAYKHVTLVENNEVAGAENNVLGTAVVAEAAARAGIGRFILVSTDKAVRPANVMGATKRLAEMVVQDIQIKSPDTRLAMVRFGNVLGSSGSVMPIFQQQITMGGPVTVTHQDMSRYFMTIPEAARLVLLAGAFSNGGEIFVLDMGQPVPVIDIARRMIELSGRTVKKDGKGDIEIKIIGSRKGEKLVEELVMDPTKLVTTEHHKILRALEDKPSSTLIRQALSRLETAIADSDPLEIRATLAEVIPGFGSAVQDNVVRFEKHQAIKR